jgi:uncharacterized membrane protein SirB2
MKHGFLPVSIDKRPIGISNFGITSIILFFLAFEIDIREKNTSNITTTILLLVGGALIGTTALGVSIMDRGGWIAFLTVRAIGYVIMGLGLLRATQQRRLNSKLSKLVEVIEQAEELQTSRGSPVS